MADFGFSSTADEVLADKDLTGRTIFVTGAYSGLGHETARALAARGATLILSGRDATKLDATADALAEIGGEPVATLVCDLADLDSIRRAGEEARQRFDHIDILINNAGVMACEEATTADGFERQFGTNHLGHFALTAELMPLIRKGSHQRIVNLSSRGHHIAPVSLDDPNFSHGDYDKWVAYGRSKTANILHAVGLEERYGEEGIHAFALHPGGIQTNLGRHLSEDDIARMKQRMDEQTRSGHGWKTIPQGAATTCWVATADELDGRGGLYAEDCHIAPVDDEDPDGGVRSYALDSDTADRLWALSEEMTGASYP